MLKVIILFSDSNKNLMTMLQAVVQDYQTMGLTFKILFLSSIGQLRFLKYFVCMVRLEYENQEEDNFEWQSFHEFLISFEFLRKLFPHNFFLFSLKRSPSHFFFFFFSISALQFLSE